MRLIRLKEVTSITGLGRSSIYKFMKSGLFPLTISLGERAVAWSEDEINEWVQDRVDARSACDSVKGELVATEINESAVIEFISKKFETLTAGDAMTWVLSIIKDL